MVLRFLPKRVRPATLGLLVGFLLLQTGCAGGTHVLAREELVNPRPAAFYRVTTRDGKSYTFISLHLEGDLLLGTIRVTSSRTVGQGETARRNITNRYEEKRLSWSDVARVEAVGTHGTDLGFLAAAGTIAVGLGVFLLLTQQTPEKPSTGGVAKK